ncbi:hypothetical protein IEQ34_014747 [Dendrobium chrysotoxum]|uniref:Uncharacterized protein n=1 Tax=Dendrobium chrysotoxum TaxID=161865 RepID=A0AAV7G413_DENCH|nr:hypothetical protein IEQ34_014747 [Dendrobium chrysotoxum]
MHYFVFASLAFLSIPFASTHPAALCPPSSFPHSKQSRRPLALASPPAWRASPEEYLDSKALRRLVKLTSSMPAPCKSSISFLVLPTGYGFCMVHVVHRTYGGACLQMKLSYGPLAPVVFVFLLQWMDCVSPYMLPSYLPLLQILVCKESYMLLFIYVHIHLHDEFKMLRSLIANYHLIC